MINNVDFLDTHIEKNKLEDTLGNVITKEQVDQLIEQIEDSLAKDV